MTVRGIRGATTADANTRESIVSATHELLIALIAANKVDVDNVASVIFTTTPDLNAEYPAQAARTLGWHSVALLCTHEMNVPHGVPMCIRVLIHWNTSVRADAVQHIYLKGAAELRPDRAIVRDEAITKELT
jgi:chorismate mutase